MARKGGRGNVMEEEAVNFDVWKKVKKSNVKNPTLLSLEVEMKGVRKKVHKVVGMYRVFMERIEGVLNAFGRYAPTERFPTGLLRDVNELLQMASHLTGEDQMCLSVMIKMFPAAQPSGLSSEEKRMFKHLKENGMALRVSLLQIQSKAHLKETALVQSVLSLSHVRLTEIKKNVERYCSELAVDDTRTPPGLRTELCDRLSELEEMKLDAGVEKNTEWARLHYRKKGLVKAIDVLIDAQAGSLSKLDTLGARGGGHCVICETDYELRSAPCSHICCKVCWRSWLEKSETCPMCRRPVTSRQLEEFLKREERKKHVDRFDLNHLSRKIHRPG